ncbi:unnamed protein product [Fraxinus pennsylvanica]|uniref:Uncharacterized protein n=1 Tax=Fraxinus pennsylvanica TaxID=56036 RepID=A0AAD1YRJ8_9LAMI|nr:unnamed protein product [Fraxinus pennsylvanica]
MVSLFHSSGVNSLDPDADPYTNLQDYRCQVRVDSIVSPRELSLCIHKLIEFRLRVRIEELEIALESIEKEAQTLDLDLCLFCHKRILEEDGQCPGCRNQYDCEPVEGEATLDGGSLTFQLARSCSMISRS